MFIGDREVKLMLEEGEDKVKIELEDGYSTVINKDLYNLIASEEKGTGNITDNINHYFSKKFVAELSQYGLEFYFAQNIGTAMGVLCHNLRENLLKNTFNCSGGDAISLKLLIDGLTLDTK